MKYQIPILKAKIEEIVSNALDDTDNPNAKVIGPYAVSNFVDSMKDNENLSIQLTQTHGRAYPKRTKRSTPYLRINAYCNLCNGKTKAKYNILITREAYEANGNYAMILIERTNEHQHQVLVRETKEKPKRTVRRAVKSSRDDVYDSESSNHRPDDQDLIVISESESTIEEHENTLVCIGPDYASPAPIVEYVRETNDEDEQLIIDHGKDQDSDNGNQHLLIDERDESQDTFDTELNQVVVSKRRIVKEERIKTAKEIITEFGGSARLYKLNKGRKGMRAPSEEALRKILSEYLADKFNIGTWIQNLCAVKEASDCLFKGKKLPGFTQQFTLIPELRVYNYSELQFKCINETPHEKRILHIDATGSMVDVADKHTKDNHDGYKRILNYFCLLKNSANQAQRGVVVSELISSSHDSNSLASFFFAVKLDYAKVYNKDVFRFRLVVIDYSWALIHSILMALNSQTVEDYAKIMYQIASGARTFDDYPLNSWLASCAAHTMKRFVNSLDKSIDRNLRRYICFCFSLMLNSTSLDQLSDYFRWICIVHLSETRSELVISSEKALIEAVKERPETLASIKKIVNRFDQDRGFTIFDSDQDELRESDNTKLDSIVEKISPNQPIKHSSPFTSHFKKIKEDVENSFNTDPSADEPNLQLNPAYINHLLDKFMPYCFIWSGFVFKGMNLTRLTNGTVENFNKFVKSTTKAKVLPHRHIVSELRFVEGMCEEYLENLNSTEPRIRKKRRDYSAVALDTLCEDGEEDFHEAREHYNKKAPSQDLGYQSKINLEKYSKPTKSFVKIGLNKKNKKATKKTTIKELINSDEIICRPFGICLRESDMNRLRNEESICDNLIMAFCLSFKSDDQLVVLPQVATQIFDNKIFDCWLNSETISESSLVALPYIVNNNHWTVILVNTISRNFIYIDPLGIRKERACELFETWKKFTRSVDWSLDEVAHSIQTDAVNCGIYICNFIQIFFSWKSYFIFDNSPENLLSYRQTMYSILSD